MIWGVCITASDLRFGMGLISTTRAGGGAKLVQNGYDLDGLPEPGAGGEWRRKCKAGIISSFKDLSESITSPKYIHRFVKQITVARLSSLPLRLYTLLD